jgi:vanillate O-demethylase ferredoxin subunit
VAATTQHHWQTGRVVEVDDAADGVRRIVLEPEQPRPAPPGSHVDLDLPVAGRTLRRSYSVVRSEDGGRRLTISVQLAEGSRGGSRHMHGLTSGDVVRMTTPVQDFPLGVGAGRYVLVAGGIGITALAAMATTLRRRGADYLLVVVGRSRTRLAYAEELLAEHGDRVRLHVSDEGTPFDPDGLVEEIESSAHAADTELYMCGPIRLMDALRRAWAARDLPRPHLRFETFGSSGSWAAEEFVVRVPALDREVVVGRDTSMLDALEAAGVEVMWDCRKGECGLCVVKVLDADGHVDHRDVFLSGSQQQRADRMCACVSRLAGAPDGRAAVTIAAP